MESSKLAEFLLRRLYELAALEGHDHIHELIPLAREVGVADPIKIYNVTKVLENRGLVKGRYSLNGRSIRACITGEGSIYVETASGSITLANHSETTVHGPSVVDADNQRYDVCLSFAGEDRAYVEQVAAGLRTENKRSDELPGLCSETPRF